MIWQYSLKLDIYLPGASNFTPGYMPDTDVSVLSGKRMFTATLFVIAPN